MKRRLWWTNVGNIKTPGEDEHCLRSSGRLQRQPQLFSPWSHLCHHHLSNFSPVESGRKENWEDIISTLHCARQNHMLLTLLTFPTWNQVHQSPETKVFFPLGWFCYHWCDCKFCPRFDQVNLQYNEQHVCEQRLNSDQFSQANPISLRKVLFSGISPSSQLPLLLKPGCQGWKTFLSHTTPSLTRFISSKLGPVIQTRTWLSKLGPDQVIGLHII